MSAQPHPVLRGIGLTIRSLRRTRGLSQEALADVAQIDRSYMSSVERGLRNVSVVNLMRIAAALNVPVRELLGSYELSAVANLADPGGPDSMGVTPTRSLHWEVGDYLSLG